MYITGSISNKRKQTIEIIILYSGISYRVISKVRISII